MLAAGVVGVAAAAIYHGRPVPIPMDRDGTVDPETLSVYPKTDQKHWSDRADCDMEIRLAKKGPAARPPATVMSWMETAVSRFPNEPAMKVEEKDAKGELQWKTTTWSQLNDNVRLAAKSFIHLGVERFDSVSIIGFNRPEWIISDLAAIWCGAKAAGIYTTNEAAACQYIVSHCKAKVVVCENWTQLEKFHKIIGELPDVKAFVVYGEITDEQLKKSSEKIRPTYNWKQFLALGREDKKLETTLTARMNCQSPGNICTLIYTSGTTGNPKAVMVTHDSITFMASLVVYRVPDWGDHSEHVISYLPLSHIAAQVIDIYCPLYATAFGAKSATLWFARPDALKGSLPVTMAMVRPTAFFGVPRVWEKIAEKMQSIGATTTGIKKKISTWAKSVGREKFAARQINGSGMTPWFEYIPDAIVFSQIRKKLGLDRCRINLTGAAPISKDVIEYLASVGIVICELYGMSECSGANTMNTMRAMHVGSIGRRFPGMEIIFEHVDGRDQKGEGEILIRSRSNMAGYLNDAKKTAETIDSNGFVHSGDVGREDENGFLYICGRIKELIITSGGENVAPVPIEQNIKNECPGIASVIMIGDHRKYNIALCTLKCVIAADGTPTSKLDGPALEVNPAVTTVEGAMKCPIWKKYLEKGIAAANTKAESNACKVQKIDILPVDFSVSGGELTPSLKLCRPAVVRKYADVIDRLYN